MARPDDASPLDRQLARVRRRLFAQALLTALPWGWTAALAFAVAWLLAWPLLSVPEGAALRWIVPVTAVVLATVIGVFVAWRRTPSTLDAALALDQRFQLRERAVTAVSLSAEQRETDAGRALLDDTRRRVEPLRVADGFPLRPRRGAALVPLLLVVLILVALFYDPRKGGSGTDTPPTDPKLEAAIDQQQQEMRKQARERRADVPKPRSRDEQLRDDQWDKLAQMPHQTPEEKDAFVKAAVALEDQIKERDKQLAERMEALKEQWKQQDRLAKKNRNQNGPAEGLRKAMKQGDLQKAQDELKRLAREMKLDDDARRLRREKLDDPNLAKDERDKLQREQDDADKRKEELKDELQDLADRVARLGDLQKELQELKRLEEAGELDKARAEEIRELLEQLQGKLGDGERQELRELAAKLAECEKCLENGKDGDAARLLRDAAGKLGRLDGKGERAGLAARLRQLAAARQAACRAMGPNLGRQEGAVGQRPEKKDGETDKEEQRARGQLDKGQKQIVDFVPAPGLLEPNDPKGLHEAVRQAAQEAPDAVERGTLPPAARPVVRGFFEKMRGPAEKK